MFYCANPSGQPFINKQVENAALDFINDERMILDELKDKAEVYQAKNTITPPTNKEMAEAIESDRLIYTSTGDGKVLKEDLKELKGAIDSESASSPSPASEATQSIKKKELDKIDRYTKGAEFKTLSQDKQEAILALKTIEPAPMPSDMIASDLQNLLKHFKGKSDEVQRAEYAKLFNYTMQNADLILTNSTHTEARKIYIKAYQHKETKDMYYLAITKEEDNQSITGFSTTQIRKVINEIKRSDKIEYAESLQRILNPANLDSKESQSLAVSRADSTINTIKWQQDGNILRAIVPLQDKQLLLSKDRLGNLYIQSDTKEQIKSYDELKAFNATQEQAEAELENKVLQNLSKSEGKPSYQVEIPLNPQIKEHLQLDTDTLKADLEKLRGTHPELFQTKGSVARLINKIQENPTFFFKNNRLDMQIVGSYIKDNFAEIGIVTQGKNTGEVGHILETSKAQKRINSLSKREDKNPLAETATLDTLSNRTDGRNGAKALLEEADSTTKSLNTEARAKPEFEEQYFKNMMSRAKEKLFHKQKISALYKKRQELEKNSKGNKDEIEKINKVLDELSEYGKKEGLQDQYSERDTIWAILREYKNSKELLDIADEAGQEQNVVLVNLNNAIADMREDFYLHGARDKAEYTEARAYYERILGIRPIAEFGKNYAEFFRDGRGGIEKLLVESKDYEARKASGKLTQEEQEAGVYKGQVAGAFYREGLGDIDLVWGDSSFGLQHILEKHPDDFKAFGEGEQGLINALSEIIENGKLIKTHNGYNVIYGDYKVGLNIGWNENGKKIGENKWIVTAFDNSKTLREKQGSNSASLTKGETLPLNSELDSTTNPANMLESAPKRQGEFVDITMPKQTDMFKNLRSKAKTLLGKLKG